MRLKNFLFSQDEKNFVYRVIKVYNKDNVRADLAEWKMPFFENGVDTNFQSDDLQNDDETPLSSFLLSLTIKNENPDKLMEFRKPLDIKYCFVCNRYE